MVKVLAIVEFEIDSTEDDSELNLLTASLIDLLDDMTDGACDEDAPGYLADSARSFKAVNLLSSRVLNSATESALNHLYPKYIIDIEGNDYVATMTRPASTHWPVPSDYFAVKIDTVGPAPTWEEALLLLGVSPSNLGGVNTSSDEVTGLSAENVQTHPMPHEPTRDSASAQGPVNLHHGKGPVGADYEGIERRIMGHIGVDVHARGNTHCFDFPTDLERLRNRNEPSRRPIPNDSVAEAIEKSVEDTTSRVEFGSVKDRLLEFTSPLGDRYTIPLNHVPDPLKEESEMLKTLRDFFTDPFKRNSRIPARPGLGGTVTGRFRHSPSASTVTHTPSPTPAQTADDLTAAVLMHAILTNDDITKADEQAKKVVSMAEAEFTPIRTTEAYHESVLRDPDPTPVESSRPVADEDRSAAAVVESRPVETSSYRDDTPSSSSWADSSGSSSSDSYSSSSSSDSYSSSSVD